MSGGSKANEFDIAGIKGDSVEITFDNSKLAVGYKFPEGNSCVILNDGKAVNFLKGGSPEEVMDVVFAEQAACLAHLCDVNVEIGSVVELPGNKRDYVAGLWIDEQESSGITMFQDL